MTDFEDKALVHLASIDASMRALVAFAVKRSASSASTGEVASDADLDGQYGDPQLKKDPPRYEGPPMAPCAMSQTTPEYLDVLVAFLEWRAAKDDAAGAVDGKGKPKSFWSRKDAARARGWAARMRAGWKSKPRHAAAKRDFDSANDLGRGDAFEDDSFDAPDF